MSVKDELLQLLGQLTPQQQNGVLAQCIDACDEKQLWSLGKIMREIWEANAVRENKNQKLQIC